MDFARIGNALRMMLPLLQLVAKLTPQQGDDEFLRWLTDLLKNPPVGPNGSTAAQDALADPEKGPLLRAGLRSLLPGMRYWARRTNSREDDTAVAWLSLLAAEPNPLAFQILR